MEVEKAFGAPSIVVPEVFRRLKRYGGKGAKLVFKQIKGWLAIAKLRPLSLFISLLLMIKKSFGNAM